MDLARVLIAPTFNYAVEMCCIQFVLCNAVLCSTILCCMLQALMCCFVYYFSSILSESRHTSHSTLHTAHCTLYTAHFTQHTAHYILHNSHFTDQASLCSLHTTHLTLHNSHRVSECCSCVAPRLQKTFLTFKEEDKFIAPT